MMSEKEREEEESSVSHISHEHPLSLIVSDKPEFCQVCGRYFTEDAAYGCKKCENKRFLHQDCAETPREIRHPMHPQHTLVQKPAYGHPQGCAGRCDWKVGHIGYFCSTSACDFQMHVFCALAVAVEAADQQICVQHPSHPQHRLLLLRKMSSFKCDACGVMETGRSYVCATCRYWIHERCAALPATMDYHSHHHPLSLAFYLPQEYIKYYYVCEVCRKDLLLMRWVYHCEICRYIVHIKCATIGPSWSPTASCDEADSQGFIQFPINDVAQDLIKPFVVRQKGEMMVIPPRDEYQKHRFPFHHHQLSLVSSETAGDEDGDLEEDGHESTKLEIICDACTMPIIHDKHRLSSSSSSSADYYMSCGECNYFLHLACFNLPPELPSHPLHQDADHNLILQACPKLNFWLLCTVCVFNTNGLFYACTKCDFKVDIKCASLPNTIKHRAHPQHHLHSKFTPITKDFVRVRQGICGGCTLLIWGGLLYKCSTCDFIVCKRCALLPPVNQHKLEKHPLPLTYHANLNHPGDFYCDGCERQMIPKEWMYHCSDCQTFFHTTCFHAASGYYKNIKFGQQYAVPAALHPHPLTYTLISTKLRCDVCRFRIYGEEDVDKRGFHCSSCNFFMCLGRCAQWRLTEISPIDTTTITHL